MRKVVKSAKAKTAIHAKTKVMGLMDILCALFVRLPPKCLKIFLPTLPMVQGILVKKDTR